MSKLEELLEEHTRDSAAEAIRQAAEFLRRRAQMERSVMARSGSAKATGDSIIAGMERAADCLMDFAADRYVKVTDFA
jgi:Flp pilus assembly protein TadB